MLFQRVALLISLVLISCSFVSAKYELRNDVLYDNENKQVTKDEYINVMENMCKSKDQTEYNETIAEWLINHGLQVNAKENLPIICAVRFGHTTLVTKLLNNSEVNPAANNNIAILVASHYGHFEVVKLLLKEKSVDPSANDNYAIRWASENGHSEVVKLLLTDERVNKALKDEFIIDLASQSKHFESLKCLLKEGKIDEKLDENYVKAYHSENGHFELLKLLLKDERVNPAIDNNEAIVFASVCGHSEVVKLLLKDGRVVPSANDNKAIHAATSFGHAAVVELLLTNSSVDATKALEIAIDKKYYGIVSIIHKAKPKLFNNETVSIDKNVLNEANKTIQVNTTISVENNYLIIHYESEFNYDATFELTSMKDDSTIYLNVFDISNGKLSIEMSKLKSNEWNWRWICAKQTIENNGKLDLNSNKSTLPDIASENEESNFPIWLIVVIVISALAFVGITAFVWFFIRSRRLGKNADV